MTDGISGSELTALKERLLPFGGEWTRRTGRALATVRDGVDFLAAMKPRDDFWAALAPLDAAGLRALLPDGELAVTGEEWLRSIGLDDGEIGELVASLDADDLVGSAVRAAFAQGRPQLVARALEHIASTSRDVVAAERYVHRGHGARTLVRTLRAGMAVALLLLAPSCTPKTSPAAPPQDAAVQQAPVVQTATAPAPTPTLSTTASLDLGVGAQPGEANVQPVRPRPPRPGPGPGAMAPRYKGVSPRRLARRAVLPTSPIPAIPSAPTTPEVA